jgi:hypothetical protein
VTRPTPVGMSFAAFTVIHPMLVETSFDVFILNRPMLAETLFAKSKRMFSVRSFGAAVIEMVAGHFLYPLRLSYVF